MKSQFLKLKNYVLWIICIYNSKYWKSSFLMDLLLVDPQRRQEHQRFSLKQRKDQIHELL